MSRKIARVPQTSFFGSTPSLPPFAFMASGGATTASGASQTRDYHSLLGWLPKLDRIAIWIFKPRKGPHRGIFLGLFDYHAFTLKMAEDFSHVFHCVINLTRSRLILDVLISGHNRPGYRSLDLRIFQIPILKRCIN